MYAHANPVMGRDPSGRFTLVQTVQAIAINQSLQFAAWTFTATGQAVVGSAIIGGFMYAATGDLDSAVAAMFFYYLLSGAPESGRTLRLAREALMRNARIIPYGQTYNPASYPNAQGWVPPYKPGSRALEFEANRSLRFVRVHNNGAVGPNGEKLSGQQGGFVVREREVLGLTPAQIQQKLGLKDMPTHITDVIVPEGAAMRLGLVGPQPNFGMQGGGIQYQLLDRTAQFVNNRTL